MIPGPLWGHTSRVAGDVMAPRPTEGEGARGGKAPYHWQVYRGRGKGIEDDVVVLQGVAPRWFWQHWLGY